MAKKANTPLQLNDFLQSLPEHFQVLETPVDVKTQLAYYQRSRAINKPAPHPTKEALAEMERQLAESSHPEEKKQIMVRLAALDMPEAYRILERYAAHPDEALRDWSIMALHESKMVLESALLDENQVYISTGLGGRNDMLRYFAVILHKHGALEPFQAKVLEGEILDAVSHAEGETEHIAHSEAFSTVQLLVPVRNDLTHILMHAIQESNAYGSFLETDLLITNMKILDEKEILQLIARKRG